jgi:hypothetical protein
MTRHTTGHAAALRHLVSAHFSLEHVSHTCGLQRYAGSGWWAGVPHEGVAAR